MANSTYYGTTGNDTLDASSLSEEYDNIDLLAGDDTVDLDTYQIFVSGPGDDTVIGDGLSSGYGLWFSNEPVYVNLQEGYASDGFGGTDTLSGIKVVHMTSFGGTVIGTANDESVFCFGGESYIDLGEGNDTVNMYQIDSMDYDVEFNNGIWSLQGNDHLIEIHNVENILFEDKEYITSAYIAKLKADFTNEYISSSSDIAKLYVATFNRAPDSEGLNYWVNESGLSISQIAQSFFDQEETQALYPANINNRDFIQSVYQNLFNRSPDTAGWNYWEDALNGTNNYGNNSSLSTIPKNRFIEAVINGAQNTDMFNDVDILNNKTTVGLKFAITGFSDIEDAKTVMSGISDSTETVSFIINKIDVNNLNTNIWDEFNENTEKHSYAYAKESGVIQISLPVPYWDIRGYADFNNDGILDIFATNITYSVNEPYENITPSEYSIWLGDINNGWTKDTTILQNSEGNYHPRKVLIDDFNQDGKLDAFVVSHGYDALPFPGDKNTITLSQPDGTYITQYAGDQVGFFHGGSTADVNNDGYPDVIITDNFDSVSALYFLINQKDGTFLSDYCSHACTWPPVRINTWPVEKVKNILNVF